MITTPSLGRARVDEALWAALIRQQEVGVAVCDADGVLVEMNARLERMLGEPYQRTTPEEWLGLYHLFDEHGEPLVPDDAPLMQALRGEVVVDRVISTRPADGTVRHLRCNGGRLHDRRGHSVGAVVFVADATAEVTHMERLQELRDQLVEMVNHELRTPATVIKGHVELLEDLRADVPDEASAHLEPILRAVARFEDVLDRIREMADLSR